MSWLGKGERGEAGKGEKGGEREKGKMYEVGDCPMYFFVQMKKTKNVNMIIVIYETNL